MQISIAILIGAVLLIPLGVIAVIYLVVPFFKGLGWLVRQVFRFIGGEIADVLRIVGAVVTQLVLIPMIVGSVIVGRWSAASHYGRALSSEFHTTLSCLYRVVVGHPARLLCLTPLTEGIEKRLPEVVAATPGPDKPPRRVGQFEGYTIVGSLPGGGSGGRLYVARPDPVKQAAFERRGQPVDQVVIKCFSLHDGSSLPQIVRESRALDAAKRLGLVLEHELTADRFFYVTRYVPGESLGVVTQRLHGASGGQGLDAPHLRQALGYVGDLLSTLDTYHRGGLWHKDVKPDNIIVDATSAHLVDLGLVTPLRSAMTLTTHGTEYFRDPELVRLALKGVKVHQVDGAKFDLYAVGAVLYSLVENSFPAHGGLSQISRRCPEALRWVIRRAMTDYDRRYASAAEMLADVRAIREAADPFGVAPADLPSMNAAAPAAAAPYDEPAHAEARVRAAHETLAGAGAGLAGTPTPQTAHAYAAAAAAPAPGAAARARPRLRVVNWWTGRYEADSPAPAPPAPPPPPSPLDPFLAPHAAAAHAVARVARARSPQARRITSRPAPEQLASARARAKAARARAHERMSRRHAPRQESPAGLNAGVVLAVFAFLLVAAAFVSLFATRSRAPGGAPRFTVSVGRDGSRAIVVGPRVGDAVRVEPISNAASLPPVPPEAPDAPAAPEVRLADLTGLTALVLKEPAAISAESARALDESFSLLEEAGLTFLGSGTGDEAGTELAADLRKTIGLSPWRSEGAWDSISAWMGAHAEVDAVIWVSRDPKGGPEPIAWIVGSAALDDGSLTALGEAFAAR